MRAIGYGPCNSEAQLSEEEVPELEPPLKKRIMPTGGLYAQSDLTYIIPSTRRINNRAALLNGVLLSNDYKERRVTRCIEVLPTVPHSALDIGAVAKP
ncbi:hypothetical protein TNCV_864211 [Trichonephila clavipes]|nr:hypothetical protein TNCV_864211 [Trichonephila clavipes]